MPTMTTTLCVYALPKQRITPDSHKVLLPVINTMCDSAKDAKMQANIIYRSVVDTTSVTGSRCEVLINFIADSGYDFVHDSANGDLIRLARQNLNTRGYQFRDEKFDSLNSSFKSSGHEVYNITINAPDTLATLMSKLPLILSSNPGSAVLVQFGNQRFFVGNQYKYPVAVSIICPDNKMLNSFLQYIPGCSVADANVSDIKTLMLGPLRSYWCQYQMLDQTIAEALCSMPDRDAPGFIRTDTVPGTNEHVDPGYVGDGIGLTFGHLCSTPDRPVGLPTKQLSKHLCVFGTPGQGKTTLLKNLLSQLYRQNVPWMVLECAKNEYRGLSAGDMRVNVFTPGRDFVSPWLWDLFSAPCINSKDSRGDAKPTAGDGITVGELKQIIKAIFEYLPLDTPIDLLVDAAVTSYFLANGVCDFDIVPTHGAGESISRLISEYQQCVRELRYASNSDSTITAAGTLRLRHIDSLFAGRHAVPLDKLMEQHSVIECQGIDNEEYRTLVIYALLRQIYAYLMAKKSDYDDDKLRFVLVIEEAHVILRRNAGRGAGRNAYVLQDFIVRMLNELRSYGVGIVIVDQSPEAVGRDVIKATTSKISFRLTEAVDCRIFSEATDARPQDLRQLRQGHAVYSSLGFNNPLHIITERAADNDVTWISDDAVHKSMFAEDGFYGSNPQLLRPWSHCPNDCACSPRNVCLSRQILGKSRQSWIDSAKERINKGFYREAVIKDITAEAAAEIGCIAKVVAKKIPDCVNIEKCLWAYTKNGFLQI